MPYSREIYEAASGLLEQRRLSARIDHNARQLEVYERIPRVKEIATALRQISAKAAQAVFDGRHEDIKSLSNASIALQDERKALLKGNGYPEDYLTLTAHCSACSDEGYIRTEMCECMKQALRDEQFKRSKLGGALGHQVFSAWNTNIIVPEAKEKMLRIKAYCERYAKNFKPGADNLFFIGAPGTGKTFMSSCIANEVARQGYSVIYDSMPNIVSKLEAVKFGRREPEEVQEYHDCDLLIMDDLGAEGITSVSEAELYSLMNGRIVADRTMIVSSNLTPQEIGRLYNERIASRLNAFVVVQFVGNDLRRAARK